ncbi:MAG: hypothetical protein F6K30_05345 [Cyanothece sp. SIO2G6]|nr:hypothetical protein [Cyanothece sp. SIO2G6]
MDTHRILFPLNSQTLQQSIDQTLLSQIMVYQLSTQLSSWSNVVPLLPSSAPSPQLGGRLSFELVKYACGLTQLPSCRGSYLEPLGNIPRKGLNSGFAPPIVPMHQRDRTILVDLFEREDMSDIHTDIKSQLGKLITEPCWDDDPYGFLSDYL